MSVPVQSQFQTPDKAATFSMLVVTPTQRLVERDTLHMLSILTIHDLGRRRVLAGQILSDTFLELVVEEACSAST